MADTLASPGSTEADTSDDAVTTKPNQLDDEGLFLKLKDWFRQDREHSAEWRKEAREDYDFVSGHQWTDEDKQVLKDEMRPVITFNRIAPTVESILGLEINNRRDVQFIPREQGDAKPNEVLTAAAEWVRQECDAEDEETDAFFDTVVAGMGWTDTRYDDEIDPEGRLVVDRIDPLEMFWDASARKSNLSDARRVWRVRCMPKDEAKEFLPGVDLSDMDASWADVEDRDDSPHHVDHARSYERGIDIKADDDKKTVTIVHVQWWEKEPFYQVAFNGRVEEVAHADFPTFESRAKMLEQAGLVLEPMRAVQKSRRVYYQAFLGSELIKREKSPCDDHFSWQCITGKRDRVKGTWYGIVRAMKDPQRWANKWLSQSLHILNSNAKGGIFAERAAFDNDADAEETYARPDRITWTKQGALTNGKIQPKPQPAFPAGFENLMQFAISSIRDVSGVNLELLGLRDANQPGVLEEHRKQAGMTILAGLFDSLTRYRKRQGRVLLFYILKYLSDGRLIRITGEQNAQYVPLVRQPGEAKYDIIVDDAPTSPNQKEKVWATVMQMMPVLGGILGPQEWATLAEYSPLPTALVDQLKAGMEQKQAAQQPVQQAQQQLMMQKGVTDAQKSTAQAEQAHARAQLDQVRAAREASAPVPLFGPR